MIRFPSLTSDQHAYEWDSSPDWSSHAAPVSNCTKMFQTFGDGMCAHSPAWAIPRENFADYCFSMTDYLAKNPQAFSDCGSIGYEWMPDITDKQIAFAVSVIYKDKSDKGKRQYYSIGEQKVSTADKLRYDKRYEKVAEWCDGSPSAVYRLLYKDHYSALQCLSLAATVEDWFQRTQDHYSTDQTSSRLAWDIQDYNQRYVIEHALSTMQSVLKAYAALSNAPRHISGYLRNLDLENDKQRAAAAAVPAEAVTQE